MNLMKNNLNKIKMMNKTIQKSKIIYKKIIICRYALKF